MNSTKQVPKKSFEQFKNSVQRREQTVYETALAIAALRSTTTDGTVFEKAVSYLQSKQSADGSWNDDPYTTALALQTLANARPNLAVASSGITYTPSVS